MNDSPRHPRRRVSLFAETRENCWMALGAITAHPLRSCLTLLGVLIGVFSIIVVMTAMRVMQSNIENQLSYLGTDTFMIRKSPGIYFGNPGDLQKFWRRKDIDLAQVHRLTATVTLPRCLGAEDIFWEGEIHTRYKTSAPTVPLYGETPGSFPAHGWELAAGRLLVDSDLDTARQVCVLGNNLATNLFPNRVAVGETLKLDGLRYLIVGVLAPRGGASGGDQDNFVVCPLTTGINRYGHWGHSLNILVQARDRAHFDATEDEVRAAMRIIRKTPPGKDDDFELSSNDSLIAQFDNFTKSVRVGVAIISSIALLAAGIGIMNIMLVSVTERTREIGIRRAIGARRRSVMMQFIIEAIVLCEVGGVLGVLLGILGGNLTALVLKLPPVIPFDWVAIGLIICSFVGILFGTYPAWKAANLDPIESLRYE